MAVQLNGVPETMLWTLHNRASEAKRRGGALDDPEGVRVYEAIPYAYELKFGKPDGSHPLRARVFDEALRPWLAAHRGGTVVELGCGLETEFARVDDGEVRWLCVDVPEAMDVRERYLPASDRCRHIRASALDPVWMDAVDASKGVFITAQGLFMYFPEPEVRRIFLAIIDRFPGAELMFDVIPPWFSRKTVAGWHRTRHYRVPPMPWGIRRSDVERALRAWSPAIARVETRSYGNTRGVMRYLLAAFSKIPGLLDVPPAIVRVSIAPRAG